MARVLLKLRMSWMDIRLQPSEKCTMTIVLAKKWFNMDETTDREARERSTSENET